MLVPVLLGDGVAADLADPTVEARAVELLDLLPTLLADLLVEVGAVTLRGRAATLLPDLLVELRTVALSGRRAALAARLGHGHGALVLGHRLTPSYLARARRLSGRPRACPGFKLPAEAQSAVDAPGHHRTLS